MLIGKAVDFHLPVGDGEGDGVIGFGADTVEFAFIDD